MNGVVEDKLQPKQDHWLGEPVIRKQGTFDQVADVIPRFRRRPFALFTLPRSSAELTSLVGENPYYDEVVRLNDEGQEEVPVGIVSKSYRLIQHRDLFQATVSALNKAEVPLSRVTTFLTLTRFGGRMALGFVFPAEYGFDPGDGHPIHRRLECLNSVEGSTRLLFLISWYRLICSNGLMTRVKLVDEAMIHTENAEIPDINGLVRDAIDSIEAERLHYTRQIQTRIDDSKLRAWRTEP